MLGVELEGETYERDWIVLDVARDPLDDHITRFICDPTQPTVIVPAPGGARRYEFMLADGESREAALAPDNLARLLRPWRPYVQEDIVRAVVYTFHARVAPRWRIGRIFLAGDAAHLTPPFAGQGMNAGLRDAANLAWKLALAVRGAAAPGLLDSYQQERMEPCRAMIDLACAMGELVMPTGPDGGRLRALLDYVCDRFPDARDYVYQMRFKPLPALTGGAVSSLGSEMPASLVGKLLPQPEVTDGGAISVSTIYWAMASPAIVQDDRSEASARHCGLPGWRAIAPRVVRLGLATMPLPSPAAQALRAHRDQIMLVRPDRFVFGTVDPEEIGRLMMPLRR